MSRREAIRMSAEECHRFLETRQIVTLSTIGRDGYPHITPLSFVLLDGRVWCWTYAKSQKVRNLERNGRAGALFESGTDYQELRGAMFKVDVHLHRDSGTVLRFATALVERYTALGAQGPDLELFRAQVPHRVALELVERSRVTWDHTKLSGVY